MSVDSASRVRFGILAFFAGAAAISYLCRNGMVLAESTIRADLGLSDYEMGFLLGPAFFWPYALLQLPLGGIGQRFGTRVWLPLLMIVTSVATILFGLGGGFTFLLVCRVVSGAAQAGIFPGATQGMAAWHPASERGMATGFFGASMSIGSAIGMTVTGYLLLTVGWKNLSIWYGIPGLLWAFGFVFFFRDSPRRHSWVNSSERELIGENSAGESPGDSHITKWEWIALLLSPALWLICTQQFFRAAAYAFFQSWFPTYLQETRGVSTLDAGWLSTLPLAGTIIGMLTGGFVSDAILRITGSLTHARKTFSIVAVIASGCTVIAAYFVMNATAAVLVISLGALFAGMAGPLAYALTIDLGGKHVTPVFALMNTVGNIGAGLLPWAVPAIRHAVEADARLLALFGGSGWNAVLLTFAGLYFSAALVWLLIRVRGTVISQSWISPRGEDADHIR